jgi:hypothetical protein
MWTRLLLNWGSPTRNSVVPAPGRCITERIPGTLILSIVEYCIIVPKLLRLELPSSTSIVAWRAPLLGHEPKRGVHEERCMACAYVQQRSSIRRKSHWHRVVGRLHMGRRGRDLCAQNGLTLKRSTAVGRIRCFVGVMSHNLRMHAS